MGIRSFDNWLKERQLTKEVPLSSLAGTRLGIDASHYLKKMLASSNEGFLAGTGGSPLALASEITEQLQHLQRVGVKPVFVFNGIQPKDRERPLVNDGVRVSQREQAWEHYEQGRVEPAQFSFATSQSYTPLDVHKYALRVLNVRHVEAIVAPYLAWAQLVYLLRHEKAYVNAVYGGSELFMFDGVDKVILDVNFKKSTFTFASKQAILRDLAVSAEQFLDIAIMAGFDNFPTFPAFLPHPSEPVFRHATEHVKSRGTAVNAIVMYPPPVGQPYLDTYARARTLIKFSLVLTAGDGHIGALPLVLPLPATVPVTKADVPADLGEVFSPRLPDEIYYQFFRGLVSPPLLTALATGYWVESPPLCGGPLEYQRFVRSLTEQSTSARCVALGLLSCILHPLWSKKQISALYYFDPNTDHPIPHSSNQTVAKIECIAKWNVDSRHIEDELRRQHSSTIDLQLCFGGTSTPSLSQRTITPKRREKLLDKKDEIVANTLWRFLELRNVLNPDHSHTAYARALYGAMKTSKVNDKFQEPLYLAVELLRSGMLHNARIGDRSWSGGPNVQGHDDDKRHMLLVMRTLSIVAVAFRPTAWTSPLSRELLVFNSLLRCLSRSMRHLLESIALNMVLRQDARRIREDYIDISLSLPFTIETNTGLGIIFKAYGDAVCHVLGGIDAVKRGVSSENEEERAQVESAKDQVITMLQEGFPNVKDVRAELARGMRFWHLMIQMVRSLASEAEHALDTELVEQFEGADNWVKYFAVPHDT